MPFEKAVLPFSPSVTIKTVLGYFEESCFAFSSVGSSPLINKSDMQSRYFSIVSKSLQISKSTLSGKRFSRQQSITSLKFGPEKVVCTISDECNNSLSDADRAKLENTPPFHESSL